MRKTILAIALCLLLNPAAATEGQVDCEPTEQAEAGSTTQEQIDPSLATDKSSVTGLQASISTQSTSCKYTS